MSELVQARFDYGVLDEAKRVRVQVKAESIRARMKRTAEDIIAIGEDLREVKAELGHGQFLTWIRAEFDMTEMSAVRFMQVASRFGKSNIMLDLPVTVLYALAAPSTPDSVVSQIQSGEIAATLSDIKAAKEAEKKRADEAERAKHEVEYQLQLTRQENTTLYQQIEQQSAPRVIEKTIKVEVENPETQVVLSRLQEENAKKEALLKQKTERVNQLTEQIHLHDRVNQQQRHNEQVRDKWRQACDAFHQGINQGMTRMVTALDAESAFESDDWARLAEVEATLKRTLLDLARLRERRMGLFVEADSLEV